MDPEREEPELEPEPEEPEEPEAPKKRGRPKKEPKEPKEPKPRGRPKKEPEPKEPEPKEPKPRGRPKKEPANEPKRRPVERREPELERVCEDPMEHLAMLLHQHTEDAKSRRREQMRNLLGL